jgi:biopolymer transport protein ExbB
MMEPSLLAAASPDLLEPIGLFFRQGGPFMLLLGLTSLVAVAAILFKALTLSRRAIVPKRLAADIRDFEAQVAQGRAGPMLEVVRRGDSVLARLAAETVRQAGKPPREIAESVQTRARAELVRLQSGMTAIDVVISIAPLLGLLGTASGLVVVFSGLESDPDWLKITAGIGQALTTTIVGMAIAVPSIIAQGFFQRRIETHAAELEVLVSSLAQVCERHPELSAQTPS